MLKATKDLRFDEAVRELELGSNTKRKTTGAREKSDLGIAQKWLV